MKSDHKNLLPEEKSGTGKDSFWGGQESYLCPGIDGGFFAAVYLIGGQGNRIRWC